MAVIEVPDWYRTVALVGVDDTGEPVVVLLDSAGRIVAVMKGEYAGTLKTVAVDAAGRIVMIPTDPADIWGNAISVGIAEMVACLTPAKRFDRRGNVVLIDSFENGFAQCSTATSGTGGAVELISSDARHGGLCAKLTGGSDASRYAYLAWLFHQIPAGKVGFELSFQPSADIQYLVLQIDYYDGATLHESRIRWNNDNEKYEYYDENGAWQTLQTGYDLVSTSGLFHPVKLVVDMANDLYVRALIRAAEVDMSSYALKTSVSAAAPRMSFIVLLYSHSGDNDSALIDNVVITQNEPA